MFYTVSFTVFDNDNSREDLTRRVLSNNMAGAEEAVLEAFGPYSNSVTIRSISIKSENNA
tara:strand:- start:119 stop:298 length:180 start_codon:yes stop_codon:yes gene_type:complete